VGDAYRHPDRPSPGEIEDVVRRRGWTLTIHRTDRPASEAALRLMTLVMASRGTTFGGR
jgi:hypothetical protein